MSSTAKASTVSTTAALGTVAGAAAIGKGAVAASALTPEKAAIAVMEAASRPQIAKTIDSIIKAPETAKSLPDKAQKAIEKASELSKDLMDKIGPESESQEGESETGEDADD